MTEKALHPVHDFVDDLAIQSDTEAIALLDQQLFRWTRFSAEPLSSRFPLWLQQSGDQIFAGECDATDEGELHHCTVTFFRGGTEPVALWKDPRWVPRHAAVQPDGAIAVVLTQGEKAGLLLLREKSERWTAQQTELQNIGG